MAGFTPGPWEARGNAVGVKGTEWWVGYPPSPPGTAICSLSDGEYIENRNEADAHLIAAAPELFEALEGLCKTHRANLYPSEFAAAHAALAKAKGG